MNTGDSACAGQSVGQSDYVRGRRVDKPKSTVGTATAVYAAVLGRRGNRNSESALQWQKDRDQPSIRIEFTHAAQTHAGIINLNDPRPLPKYYELTVNVVNHGETLSS